MMLQVGEQRHALDHRRLAEHHAQHLASDRRDRAGLLPTSHGRCVEMLLTPPRGDLGIFDAAPHRDAQLAFVDRLVAVLDLRIVLVASARFVTFGALVADPLCGGDHDNGRQRSERPRDRAPHERGADVRPIVLIAGHRSILSVWIISPEYRADGGRDAG
jgi:hypothetical protein